MRLLIGLRLMELTPKQAEAIENESRWKVLNWGRRSGKTTELAYEALGTALTVDNARVTYYAQTRDDARDISFDIFKEIFGASIVKTNETHLEFTIKNLVGGTSKVSLKGWESVQERGKGRGTENDLLLIDEVAFCRNFLPNWDKVLEPTLLTSKGRVVFSSTPNGFNDFHVLANKAQSEPEWFYSHATSYDNPFNSEKELERLKKSKTDDAWAQEYMADFRRMEGLVYKEFVRAAHIYNEIPPYIDIVTTIGGHDFGTNNPCAAITIKKDQDARYWVESEWYETGKTDAQQADYVSALRWDKCFPDPSSASGIIEMKNRGINVRDVIKGKDSVRSGITTVKELFKTGRLKIHESCHNLIWELETYAYPEKKSDKNEEENPIKENDHALDALRYALMMDNQASVKKTRPRPPQMPRQKTNIAV